MNTQAKNRSGKRSWITILAVILIAAGVLAFAVPLVLQKINYDVAAKKAAEAESQMVIPGKDDYQPVDYSNMKKGVTPNFSVKEMEEAAAPPGLLEELGITGDPSSLLFGIFSAKAENMEPASMREALNLGAQALQEAGKSPYEDAKVTAALAMARKQVENAFFLLTQIQPITDTETLASLSNQKVMDGLTRGDKTITAAREMIYGALTDLEEMLKQVEDQAVADGADVAENRLFAQMNTLASYMMMAALHLPEDDCKAAMAQHREFAVLAGQDTITPEDKSGYAPIDQDNEKRSYLLEIPDIGVKVAAYRSGTFNKMYQNMRIGAAMFPRAPEPDTVANICISAHRTGTRDYFRSLNKLSVGDTIYLHTSHLGSFQYEVVKVGIIEANDWSVTGDAGYPALTLLSCQANGGISNAQRIMVRAKLVGVANGQQK